MNKYQIVLGKNSASFKKVYVSLPNGVHDLKTKATEGMILDRSAYMYAFSHGLKDLINFSVVKVVVKPSTEKSTAVKVLSSKTKKAESKEVTEKQSVVSEEAIVNEKTAEQPVEQTVEQAAEVAEVAEESSEQPKKKSKKKK